MICARIGIEKAIKIGELLTQQKARMKHGYFTRWVNAELPFTDRTARNYMRIYTERDRLKTETISVLTDGYKLLSGGKTIDIKTNRPIDIITATFESLIMANGVPLDHTEDSLYQIYWEKARGLTGICLKAMEEYEAELEAIDSPMVVIRELVWLEGVAGKLANYHAEGQVWIDRKIGQLLIDIEAHGGKDIADLIEKNPEYTVEIIDEYLTQMEATGK